jgi:hypothetical protein
MYHYALIKGNINAILWLNYDKILYQGGKIKKKTNNKRKKNKTHKRIKNKRNKKTNKRRNKTHKK